MDYESRGYICIVVCPISPGTPAPGLSGTGPRSTRAGAEGLAGEVSCSAPRLPPPHPLSMEKTKQVSGAKKVGGRCHMWLTPFLDSLGVCYSAHL